MSHPVDYDMLIKQIRNMTDQLEEAKEKIRMLQKEISYDESCPHWLNLTASEWETLSIILKRGVGRRETIMMMLFGNNQNPPGAAIIDVFVNRIRKKLKPYNISIDAVWGEGFKISPDGKRRFKEIMEEQKRISAGLLKG